jgi:hypothetical protein
MMNDYRFDFDAAAIFGIEVVVVLSWGCHLILSATIAETAIARFSVSPETALLYKCAQWGC